jgi:hypothetical protein
MSDCEHHRVDPTNGSRRPSVLRSATRRRENAHALGLPPSPVGGWSGLVFTARHWRRSVGTTSGSPANAHRAKEQAGSPRPLRASRRETDCLAGGIDGAAASRPTRERPLMPVGGCDGSARCRPTPLNVSPGNSRSAPVRHHRARAASQPRASEHRCPPNPNHKTTAGPCDVARSRT